MSDEIRPEIVQYVQNLQGQLEQERTRRMTIENNMTQSSVGDGGKDRTIVELQLELDETLNQIFHQLSGHEVAYNEENKKYDWVEPKDDRLKNFSEYGVKVIMNKLKMYLNINTLMGYYDEDTIKWKVKDFGIELSDLFLTRYEHLLYYPTPEELHERYRPSIINSNKDKAEGERITDEEIYNKCVRWSEQELAARENLIPSVCWDLINMVHSTYTRAFQGKERTSLGERGVNITQNMGGESYKLPTNKGGFLGAFRS